MGHGNWELGEEGKQTPTEPPESQALSLTLSHPFPPMIPQTSLSIVLSILDLQIRKSRIKEDKSLTAPQTTNFLCLKKKLHMKISLKFLQTPG